MLGWNRITILWLPLGLVLILVLQETRDHLLPTASASPVPSLTTPVAMVEVTGKGYRYWPRWRGPTGQGLAVDSGYPDTWSDRENVIWKVKVPGSGNSSARREILSVEGDQ